MTPEEITAQLEAIAGSDHFLYESGRLIDAWKAAGLGFETVEPILRFVETHPDIDYGTPGYLAHFMETFYLSDMRRCSWSPCGGFRRRTQSIGCAV